MDFGLIVLFIIFSVVGSIIKESKKQTRGKRWPDNGYSSSKTANPLEQSLTKDQYGNRRVSPTGAYPKPVSEIRGLLDNGIEDLKHVFEEFRSLRDEKGESREVINENPGVPYVAPQIETFETQGMEGHSVENTNPKVPESLSTMDNKTFVKDTIELTEDFSPGIMLDKDSLINAIILSEVLGPPRCRR